MSLVLEIEFLTGLCRAAHGPGDDFPDWPPQPDRVFSALVSAWGVRGESPKERAALEWLESQPPPVICASESSARTAPEVFVPPNDLKSSSAMHTYLKVLPDRRPRQPRRFPVARPDIPNMKLVWENEPDAGVLDDLNSLSSCVGYVGHSASLTRCRFIVGTSEAPNLKQMSPVRRTYPGRLRELEEAHRANPERPVIRPGAPVFEERTSEPDTPSSWLVLEAVEGKVPDIRASALVSRLIRHALLAGYKRAGLENSIPEILSGHALDGKPTRLPHLTIAPLAFLGSAHADGRVFGFALIPPKGETLLGIDGFRAAFEAVTEYRMDKQRRVLSLRGTPLHKPLKLSPVLGDREAKRSLSPDPYMQRSRVWASATPIVLERHLKRKDDTEVRELVAQACVHAGLPQPDANNIRAGKHSAVQGAPAARPLAGEPPWTRWKLPSSLASRHLVHAVFEFGEEVSGPVLIGAGRFTGLGLCRALRP